MDEALARSAFDDAVAHLRRITDDGIGIGKIEVVGRTIFVTITCANSEQRYRLKIECGEAFPARPPEYLFVNPATREDDGESCWPDDGQQSFKTGELPRWICIQGTAAYASRHAEYQYNATRDTINRVVFQIMRRING